MTKLAEVSLDPAKFCCLPPLRATTMTTEDNGATNDSSGGGGSFDRGGAVGFGAGAVTDRVGGGGFNVVGNLRRCYARIVVLDERDECPKGGDRK